MFNTLEEVTESVRDIFKTAVYYCETRAMVTYYFDTPSQPAMNKKINLRRVQYHHQDPWTAVGAKNEGVHKTPKKTSKQPSTGDNGNNQFLSKNGGRYTANSTNHEVKE